MVNNSFKIKRTRKKSRRRTNKKLGNRRNYKKYKKSKVKHKIKKMRGGARGADRRGPPACFLCPITQQIMENPVIDREGNTYERDSITTWLGRSQTSPITRSPLQLGDLVENRILKQCIDDFKEKYPLDFIRSQISSLNNYTVTSETPTLRELFNVWCEENGVEYEDLGSSGSLGDGPHQITLNNILIGNNYELSLEKNLDEEDERYRRYMPDGTPAHIVLMKGTATITRITLYSTSEQFRIFVHGNLIIESSEGVTTRLGNLDKTIFHNVIIFNFIYRRVEEPPRRVGEPEAEPEAEPEPSFAVGWSSNNLYRITPKMRILTIDQ